MRAASKSEPMPGLPSKPQRSIPTLARTPGLSDLRPKPDMLCSRRHFERIEYQVAWGLPTKTQLRCESRDRKFCYRGIEASSAGAKPRIGLGSLVHRGLKPPHPLPCYTIRPSSRSFFGILKGEAQGHVRAYRISIGRFGVARPAPSIRRSHALAMRMASFPLCPDIARLPPTRIPFSSYLTAPYLRAPTFMTVGRNDEMAHCNCSVHRAVFAKITAPKTLCEIEGGHFGSTWSPGALFDEASALQAKFLREALFRVTCRSHGPASGDDHERAAGSNRRHRENPRRSAAR
jgi:hypothetical protein